MVGSLFVGFVGLGVLGLGTGCGGDGALSPTPVARRLLVVGRLERGLAVRLSAVSGRDTVPVAGSTIAVTPAGSAVVAGDSVLLLRAGTTRIAAAVGGNAVGGDTVHLDTVVVSPPSIVFDAIAQGNRDIYRMALDGGELARLTTSPGEDIHPSVAGQLVVFTSYRDGNGELYEVGADGSGEVRLSRTGANETAPAIAPNGQSIAYLTDSTGFSRAWLATNGFANPHAVSAVTPGSAPVIESGVAWSPASDRLILVSTATPSGNAGLFVMPATAGAAAARIPGSGDLGPEVEPSWAASGSAVAYAAARRDTTTIFTRDVATGAETQILHGLKSVGQPAWLPDGRIVFTDFSGQAPALKWVDPAAPGVVHAIPTPGLAPQHPFPLASGK